jgi:hypothetical protein
MRGEDVVAIVEMMGFIPVCGVKPRDAKQLAGEDQEKQND